MAVIAAAIIGALAFAIVSIDDLDHGTITTHGG